MVHPNSSGQDTWIHVRGANPVQQSMAGNKFANPTWTFPSDLGSIEAGEEPYIIFNIISSVAVGKKLLGSIALNMPSSVVSSYLTQYEDMPMGVDSVVEAFKQFAGSAKDKLELGYDLLGKIFSNAGMESIQGKYDQSRGKVVNPHMANLFKGVDFRQFQFDFDMVPKNKTESDNINQIIRQFKFHMHPSLPKEVSNTRYFIYPSNFVIGLFSPKQDYMFKISTCVLTKMDVDYGGTGSPAFFKETGAPVAIKMTLHFKEIEYLTQERINEGY